MSEPHETDANGHRVARARRLAVVVSALVLLVAVAAVYLGTRPDNRPHAGASPQPDSALSTQPGAASPSGAPTQPQAAHTCPLTGLEPTDPSVLRRPAMAVKVDNAPEARPQPALNRADVVFEEPVEYRLTRLVPVFHCQNAPRVGPVRGGRLVDRPMLQQLRSTVIMVHAGGITHTRARIADAPYFFDLDVLLGSSRGTYRDHDHFPPHDLFTSADRLREIHRVAGGPPRPLFAYSTEPPAAADPGTRVRIPFDDVTDVRWRYDRATHRYVRHYTTTSATSSGRPVTADNVIVQHVELVASRYVEDIGGAHEWIVHLVGTGPSTVFRDGHAVPGRWIREDGTQPTTFVDRDGRPISLRPGRTWWEIVPEDVHVTWE